MGKSIRVFKSFEEQEQYHLEQMASSTVQERFRRLYLMQQWTLRMHPVTDNKKKIIIRKWIY